MAQDPETQFEQVVERDGRYPLEAFRFLHAGLEYTVRRCYGEQRDPKARQHVTGQQLCEGLRDLALELWGPLAGEVLRRWGIVRTRDFGEMVFLLVRHGLMGKQESDTIEDFDDVYDFTEAFQNYRVDLSATAQPGGADA